MSLEVEYKGTQIAQLTQDGSLTLETAGTWCEDDIELTYSGGGVSTLDPDADVVFFDYDGTLIATYSAEEFASVTELPPNPTHEGLVAQGWNWSLADAKEYVADYGFLDIGQMYTTVSGATEIDIELQEGRLSPWCGFAPDGAVMIDWGDGSFDIVTGSSTSTVIDTQHTYAAAGKYTIKLTPGSGTTYAFTGNNQTYARVLRDINGNSLGSAYRSAVYEMRIGDSCIVADSAFNHMTNLKSITLPKDLLTSGGGWFQDCWSVMTITLPTGKGTGSYFFYNGRSLYRVSIPNNADMSRDSFTYCSNLKRVAFTKNGLAVYSVCNCSTLTRLAIREETETIGSSAFQGCSSITNIILPKTITTIGDLVFSADYSLAKIEIPKLVTSIGSKAFENCYGMGEYHFLPTTPPTLANINAFTGIPSDCVIYVPKGSLNAYQTATNWSTYASYMQEYAYIITNSSSSLIDVDRNSANEGNKVRVTNIGSSTVSVSVNNTVAIASLAAGATGSFTMPAANATVTAS